MVASATPAPSLKCSRLLHTVKKEGHNTIYVFKRSNHGGVVLMSGFEGADVLGYTDEGGFNIDSIAPGLQFLLNDYSQQILQAQTQWNSENAEKVCRARKALEEEWYQPIEPLIQTRWNQWAPYDNLVPEGCPTGCVATMMAQLMKYYNYPTRGTGTHSYQWQDQTLSADFGATTYHWDQMLDRYSGNCYTEQQAAAVATLMYHCGVAVDMNYTPSASSASIKDAMTAMQDYFGYNKSASYESYQETETSRRLLYDQLANRHPVPISGRVLQGSGHAFLLDGYKDGLFHANFGWGGISDGYYSIDPIVPGLQIEYYYYKYIITDIYPSGSYTPDTEGGKGEFTVSQPGTLKQMLGSKCYSSLTLHGSINGEDLRELRARCGCDDYGYYPVVQGLTSLDLSDVQIVDGGTYYATHYSDGTVDEYSAKANTLGYHAFAYSMLRELCLPATVEVLQGCSVFMNYSLEYLLLPRDLKTYSNYALVVDAQSTPAENVIHLPEGCQAAMKDGALYVDNYRRLCLVTGQHDVFQPDNRCEDVASGAFSLPGCQVGTVVIPRSQSTFVVGDDVVKRWWLGECVSKIDLEIYKSGSEDIDLYLFSDQMVTLGYFHSDGVQRVRNVYVPSKLVSAYRANTDKWAKFGYKIRAIEDANICIDDRHVSIPSTMSIMSNVSAKMHVTLYDTNLYAQQRTWTSSNPSVATVASDGSITALAQGQTTITLHIGSYTLSCLVTVEGWPTVHVEDPGTLASLIKDMDHTMLRVTGNINGTDLRELRALCGCTDNGFTPQSAMSLRGLDLSDANIVTGGVYYDDGDSYSAKKDELGYMLFCNTSQLTTLLLPNSVHTMHNYAIWSCRGLNAIYLPENLRSCDSPIAYSGTENLNIIVPPTSCLVKCEEGIYSKDFSNLYFAKSGYSSKLIIDPRCQKMNYYTFSNGNCSIDTLITPNIVSIENVSPYVNKALWLGTSVNNINPGYIHKSTLKLFLPANYVVKLIKAPESADYWDAVYVPEKLLSAYKEDPMWQALASKLQSIEASGAVLDQRRVIIPDNVELMAHTINDFSEVGMCILDTKLLNATPHWSSSNSNVVAINDAGVVTANTAGTAQLTISIGDTTRGCLATVKPWPSIHVSKAGTLSSLLNGFEDEYLSVSGNLNGDDLYCLRRMTGACDISADGYYVTTSSSPTVLYLDMVNARITKGGVYGMFWGHDYSVESNDIVPNSIFECSKLRYLAFPYNAGVNSGCIIDNSNELVYIELPANLVTFYRYMLNDCPKLRYLVYRGENFLKLSQPIEDMSGTTLYVHESLLQQYRADSNYTATFLAIEPLEDGVIPLGIEAISADGAQAGTGSSLASLPIYSLSGLRLRQPQRGINIIGGRKVVVK